MKDTKELYVVFDTNVVDKPFIIGIFGDEWTAGAFEKRYKSKFAFPSECYTEVMKYDFPYNILEIRKKITSDDMF
jgi:hypothetical protein